MSISYLAVLGKPTTFSRVEDVTLRTYLSLLLLIFVINISIILI